MGLIAIGNYTVHWLCEKTAASDADIKHGKAETGSKMCTWGNVRFLWALNFCRGVGSKIT